MSRNGVSELDPVTLGATLAGLAGIANGYVTLVQAAPLLLVALSFALGATFFGIGITNLVAKAWFSKSH
jgi:ABC-type amino acid transport system permease subunit